MRVCRLTIHDLTQPNQKTINHFHLISGLIANLKKKIRVKASRLLVGTTKMGIFM